MKTPNLLSGTAQIINGRLTEILGQNARFDTFSTALKLKPPGGSQTRDLQVMSLFPPTLESDEIRLKPCLSTACSTCNSCHMCSV